MDSVATHLRGYGVEDVEDDGVSYRMAVPRALDLLAEAGARATFFLVADEARRHPELVRAIALAGHEVACHSMSHPAPFRAADPTVAEQEIRGAKSVLESLSSTPVLGFRAPSWGVSPGLLETLRTRGFLYDASSFPSWMLYLARRSVYRRGAAGRAPLSTSLRDTLLAPASPQVVRHPLGDLVEIPVTTVPFLRVPYYHTLRLLLPGALFLGVARGARLRRGPITYTLHAVDFLGLEEDRVDPRLGRHPGMALPLARKLALVRRALEELGRQGRAIGPLVALARALLGAEPP